MQHRKTQNRQPSIYQTKHQFGNTDKIELFSKLYGQAENATVLWWNAIRRIFFFLSYFLFWLDETYTRAVMTDTLGQFDGL